jgi:hypothetical protein
MSTVRRISLRAVALGALTDIVGTNVLLIPVAIVVMLATGSQPAGSPPPDLVKTFTDDPRLYSIALVLGATASVAGGWVAARIAQRHHRLHGALSAVACMLSGIYAMFTSADKLPLWQHVAFFVLSPALGALGGSLQARSAPRAGVRLDDAVARSARQRVGLVVNGLLIALASFVAVVFGSFGIAGYLQGQLALIVGAVVFAAVVLTGTWLLMAARSALRGGRRHWLLHVSGLALVVVPIVVIAAASAHAR